MKRAVALLRVSTEQQDPENQRRPIEIEAARDGEVIAPEDWLVETGSGAAVGRPKLDAIEGMIRAGEIRAVYVWSIDRLLRDRARWAALVPLFQVRGVELRIVTGNWRLFEQGADPFRALMSQLFADFFVAIAVYEREMIRARTIVGLEKAVRDGRLPGRPRVRLTGEQLDAVRARIAAGESPEAVCKAGLVGWIAAFDEASNTWTEKPYPVSPSALRRRLSGLYLDPRPRKALSRRRMAPRA